MEVIDIDEEVRASKALINARIGLNKFAELRLSDHHSQLESVQLFMHTINRLEFYQRTKEVKGEIPLIGIVEAAANYGSDGFGWLFFESLKSLAIQRDSEDLFKLSSKRARATFNELLTVGMYLAFSDIEYESLGHTLH